MQSATAGLTVTVQQQGEKTLVIFSGVVDERSDLGELRGLSGSVTFDLGGINRFNSEGVRRWIHFVRDLDAVTELFFIRCSVAVVTQMNMIFGFRGKAEILSFYAPYACAETGQEENRLLTREDIVDTLHPPAFPCEGGVLELDDVPGQYFAFLKPSGARGTGDSSGTRVVP